MATINEYYPQSVTHPAVILAETLEENNMGAKEFAVKTGKPEKTISAVLKSKSSITPDMAMLFEQVLKIPAHFWIEAQRNYDEYVARLNFQKNIDNSVEWAKQFPYLAMANLGWLSKTTQLKEKVVNLFNYFGIANQKGFEDYYYNQATQVAFRISLKNQDNAPAIAAWLRQGELQAKQQNVPAYSKSKLKSNLPLLKKLMVQQPQNFYSQLLSLCAEAGVKVVATPCLPKTQIKGSTRWLNDTPLIQLNNRYKRNDIFWFTFFHEVGHILLHGKKYFSIENLNVKGEKKQYENEANNFAADWLLNKKQEAIILGKAKLSAKDVEQFAKTFKTHPACIAGRLQHLGKVSNRFGKPFFEDVEIP